MSPTLIGGIAIAAITLGIILTILLRRKPKSPPVTDTVNIYRSILGSPAASAAPAVPSEPSTEDTALSARLHQELRLKFLYQEDKVARAVQLERDRDPTASENELMQAAIDRFERDNR